MMKKIILIFALLIAFQSCDVVVDLEIEDHDPVLVLNSVLDPDSVVKVSLSHSLGAFESGSISVVENATVRLYENDVHIADATFENVDDLSSDSYYKFAGVYPLEGKFYKIEAEHSDYTSITALSGVPNIVEIMDVYLDSLDYNDSEYWPQFKLSFDLVKGIGPQKYT